MRVFGVTQNLVTLAEMGKENGAIEKDYWISYPVRLLSLEGACNYLSCSGDLLEELISMGHIPIIRLGREPKGNRDRRKRWVDRCDLDTFIEKNKVKIGS